MAIDKICKNCVFWLECGDRIKDYGYCVRRDCYRPEMLGCDAWQARSKHLKKEAEK